MQCNKCGGAVTMFDMTKTGEWSFEEDYRCVDCGLFGCVKFNDGTETLTGCLA